MSNLFGRNDLLEEIKAHLADPPGNCILVEGASGIGKSAILYELRSLLASAPGQIVLHHEIESRAEPLGSLLGRLLVPLLDHRAVREFNWERFRSALNRAPWERSRSLATAALLDIVATLAPGVKKTADTLTRLITEALSEADLKSRIDDLLEERRQDFLLAFLSVMRVVESMGLGGYLLIDRLDAASPQAVAAVKSMVEGLPPAWGIVLAINNEVPEGIEARGELWPSVAYRSGHRVEVSGLNALHVEEWLKSTGRLDIPHETVERVVRVAGGRPLFIREWLSHPTLDVEQSEITRRLSAYYDRRLARLSSSARSLIRHLSLLPIRTGFPFDLCSTLLPNDHLDALEVIEELLLQNFLERDPAGVGDYRIVHETTSRVLHDQIPTGVKRLAAARLLDALVERPLPVDRALNRYCQVVLAKDASRPDVMRGLGLETAKALMESGTFGLAEETLDLTIAALTQGNFGDQAHKLEFEARVMLASLRFHVGSYEKGLDEISRCEPLAKTLGRIGSLELLRGMLLVRLNDYGSALAALKKSSRAFRQEGDWASTLKAAKFVNITLRDRGLYGRAIWHAKALVARARRLEVGGEVLSSCLRALARSMALGHQTEAAVAASGEAYAIASSSGKTGDLGNAMLAKGEALRHGGSPGDAETCYREALEIAKLTFNRDSAIWSGLGLTDSLILQRRYQDAMSVLAVEVAALVRASPERHPIEHLHWRYTDATLRFLKGYCPSEEVEAAAKAYSELGIEWAEANAALVVERGLHTPFMF